MDCKLHNKPKSMTCLRCSADMCPRCAEFIDGSWFCPECAVTERRIAAGLNYQDLLATGMGETPYVEDSGESDIAES
jgi:hypothetical protein